MEGRSETGAHGSRRKRANPQFERARPKYLDELTFNPDKGVLSAPNGSDIIVINRQTLGTVFEGMRQMLQSSADLVWYNAGEHAGEAEGKRLKKLTTKMDPKNFLHLITDLYTNLGWGKTTFEGLSLRERTVTIFTESNPLTRDVKSRQPVCHYIKGFYKGFSAVIFPSDQVTVEEVSCEATGARHCEFRIRW